MAYWGNNPTWQRLSGPQRAAAMALLEARVGRGGIDASSARNALGAMINRAEAEGQPLAAHVSRSIYQPIIEDAQLARLPDIINSPQFKELTQLASARASGAVGDWVSGADHYLVPPKTMLALEEENPSKYRSWRDWTKYNPETGQYENVVLKDGTHHFLKLYGDKSPIQAEAAPRTASTTQSQQEKPMISPGILSSLFGQSAASGGTAIPQSVAPPNSVLGFLNNNLFNSGGGSSQNGSFLPGGPSAAGGSASANLAQTAMTNAAGNQEGPQSLQRKPVNMAQFQQLLKNRPMLGAQPGYFS